MDGIGIFERITKLLEQRHMSIDDLAKSVGISRSTIYNLKYKNSSLRVSTAEKIAEKLGCATEYLLQFKREEPYKLPNERQIEITLYGDLKIFPENKRCRIFADRFSLPEYETRRLLKKALFRDEDARDDLLDKVVKYARYLNQ